MIGEWIGKRLGTLRIFLCITMLGVTVNANASFHLWKINEVYSNASGNIQFIEFVTTFGNQQFIANHNLAAAGNFTFPSNLPGDSANRKFLVGTSGFAALNIVAPDYIIPDNFLALPNGMINFAGVDIVSYASLPTDGTQSFNRIGTSGSNFSTATNSPTNFAGATGTIPAPVTVSDPPTIGIATAGNGQITVAFSVPSSDGGSAITGYTATCGSQNASGGTSPIIVMGLANGAPVTCRVIANNAQGSSAPSAASNSVTPATVPGAPSIGVAYPGNGQAFISFTPPTSNGGAAITGYTATCNPGLTSGIETVSPITVSGLANMTTVACSVTATNSAGPGAASATVNVTPELNPVLTPIAVRSRKAHPGVGTFDLPIRSDIAIGGQVSIEPRNIGPGHSIIFLFNTTVSTPGTVTVKDANLVSVGMGSVIAVGREVIVTLTDVPDNQRVTISLANVNGASVNVEASMGFLVGDVSGSRFVNASDISAVKAHLGQATNTMNYRFDVDVSGDVMASDVSIVKSRAGLEIR